MSDVLSLVARDSLVPLAPFVVDSVALAPAGDDTPTLKQCEEGFRRICKISDGIKYWRGDLMNLTEGLFAEEASQVIDHEMLTESEANAERFVASHVSPTTRSHAQSWEHARVVAKLDKGAQLQWLDRARGDDWTARKLAQEIAIATSDGKTITEWTLVANCQTEAKMEKLASHILSEGMVVLRKQGIQRKVKKAKKQVTAKAKRPAKMSARRRAPK